MFITTIILLLLSSLCPARVHTHANARACTHTHTHAHARTRARARTHTHTVATTTFTASQVNYCNSVQYGGTMLVIQRVQMVWKMLLPYGDRPWQVCAHHTSAQWCPTLAASASVNTAAFLTFNCVPVMHTWWCPCASSLSLLLTWCSASVYSLIVDTGIQSWL